MPPVESSAYGKPVIELLCTERVVRTQRKYLNCIWGGGRSMQFNKKLNLFVLVCLQCAKLDHIKLVACIQPPPASGQFRRGVVTMPASKQHLIHNHNCISFHYVHEKQK